MRIKKTPKVLEWPPKFNKKVQSSTQIAAARLKPSVSY